MTAIPTNPPPAPPDTKLFSELVPKEYHDRPYLKDILAMPQGDDATNALYKKLDNAEKLIGKKTGIPEADAPAEEWDQFYAKLRPEKPEDYEVVVKEGGKIDEKFAAAMKQAFHKAGLRKSQGRTVQEVLVEAVATQAADMEASEAKINEEFARLTKETFSDDNADAMKRVKALLKENTPDNLKVHVERLPNESLVVLMGVLNNVHAKYIAEGAPLDNKGGGGGSGGGDEPSMRDEMHKLQASDEYKNVWNPRHKEVRARVGELASELAKHKTAGKKK